MKDKRKFPRIVLGRLLGNLQSMNEAKIVSIDGEKTSQDVFDISYDSVAFMRPGSEFEKGQFIEFEVKLTGFPVTEFFGEIVRLGADLVAVQLRNVPGDRRLILEKFLKDKMIGHNTYLIAREFYTKKADFSHWYHGPNETNIILWRNGDQLERAILELDQNVLNLRDGEWYSSGSRRNEFAAYDEYSLAYNEAGQVPAPALLKERSLSIVAQMLQNLPPHQKTALQVLADQLNPGE